MTEAEKRLWPLLRSGQTEGYRFRRQVPIGRFVADFVCHTARVIVEINGGQHDLSSEEEASRTRFLESEGYRVLRFWNNEVLGNPEGVHSVIAENLHQVTPTQTLPHQGGGPEGFDRHGPIYVTNFATTRLASRSVFSPALRILP